MPGAGTSPCAGPCVVGQHVCPENTGDLLPAWGQWVSRSSWHRLPWVGTSDGRSPSLAAPPPGRRVRVPAPWVGRWLQQHRQAGESRGAGRLEPRGPGLRRDCWSPPFSSGNRGSSFHLLQKAGPLERPDGSRNSLSSIPATDCPGVVPMATVVLPGSSGSCEEKGHRDLPSGSGPACLLSVGAPPSCSQLGTTPWPLVCTPGISWQGPSLVS